MNEKFYQKFFSLNTFFDKKDVLPKCVFDENVDVQNLLIDWQNCCNKWVIQVPVYTCLVLPEPFPVA